MAKLKKHIMSDEEFEEHNASLDSMVGNANYNEARKIIPSLIKASIGSNYKVAHFYTISANLHFLQGGIEIAIEQYLIAESYCKKEYSDLFITLIQIKNSLGILYNIQKNYKKALTTLFTSVKIGEQYKVSNSCSQNNIGIVYSRMGENESAFYFYQNAINEYFKHAESDPARVITYFLNKAKILNKLGRLVHCEFILNKLVSMEILDALPKVRADCLIALADLFLRSDRIVEAEETCSGIRKLIHNKNLIQHEVFVSLLAAEIFKKLGDKECCFKELEKAFYLTNEIHKNRTITVLIKKLEFYEYFEEYEKGQDVIFQLNDMKKDENVRIEKSEFGLLLKDYKSNQKDKAILLKKNYNNELIKKNEKLEEAIDRQNLLEVHLKSLQLQLSPHFIFNTLQSIQGFIFRKDAWTTSNYLAMFAGLMRSVLNAAKKDKISIAEELDILETYLELEQKRFEYKFEYKVDISGIENIDKTFLPSLLIQPFIENAIIHGLSSKVDGKLYVVFRNYKKYLFVHVIDNGIGRELARLKKIEDRIGTSTALKIMQERQEYSRASNKFYFEYRILNRKLEGTHVVLRVLDLLY